MSRSHHDVVARQVEALVIQCLIDDYGFDDEALNQLEIKPEARRIDPNGEGTPAVAIYMPRGQRVFRPGVLISLTSKVFEDARARRVAAEDGAQRIARVMGRGA